jgi:ribosome-binding factor A
MRGKEERRAPSERVANEEGAGHRHLRVQGLIFEELRSLLRDDVQDPALERVRVRAVVLSVDYRHARVHFVLCDHLTADARAAQRALERATPFLRARLADAIEMKRVPDLRFVFDGISAQDESADGDEGAT